MGEGENAPREAVEIEGMQYIAEFYGKMSMAQPKKDMGKGGKGKRGGDKSGRGGKNDAKPATTTDKA